MISKYCLRGLLWASVLTVLSSTCAIAEDEQTEKKASADRYLELGTVSGALGGDRQKVFERAQIKAQILTFIPPLLRPALTQHAYVLPPGAFSVSLSSRFTEIEGDDFFRKGRPNRAVFGDFNVKRHFSDFDFFYGFDLNRKYLHSFTLRVNVPYLESTTDGFVHPNGQPFISLENAGSTEGIGDVGIFIKKKLFDQGTFPLGLAVVGAVFLPTGANDETFGSNGRITAKRPQPPNTTVAQGFDAIMQTNVANGVWGAPPCFFRNFNLANRGLCDGPADGPGGAFGAPGAAVLSFAPGGANFDNAFVGDFPFNNGVFGRFSGDGRLPTPLQPGTGSTSYLVGAFLTRQLSAGGLLGRSAFHAGVAHRFVSEEDGIDPGDTTTVFASFVKPFFKDFLSFDLTFVGFDKDNDSYAGKIPEPEIHTCDAVDVANFVGACPMVGVGGDSFVFELIDRPDFSGGFTGFLVPSIIYSPDPQIRLTFTALFRVVEPDLGPAPDWVIRTGMDVIF